MASLVSFDARDDVVRENLSFARSVLCCWRTITAGCRIGRERAIAQRPQADEPINLKMRIHFDSAALLWHGTRSTMGYGETPAVHTRVALVIRSPVVSSISLGCIAAYLSFVMNLPPALSKFPVGVASEFFAEFWENEFAGMHESRAEASPLLNLDRTEARRGENR